MGCGKTLKPQGRGKPENHWGAGNPKTAWERRTLKPWGSGKNPSTAGETEDPKTEKR